MKACCFLLVLSVSSILAHAQDKPLAYDHITKDGAAIDQQVNAALSRTYAIKPVEDSPAYVPSQAISGTLPTSAKTSSGEPLSGYVLIAYVVSAKGHAVDPVVLKTTDPRLNSIAIKCMGDWKFNPAKLNDNPIATTAAQEFNFTVPPPAQGFTLNNIVLYQPNEVLSQRTNGADQLAAYIQSLQTALTDYFKSATTPGTLNVVVAARAGYQSRVWFVTSTHSGDFANLTSLREKLEAIKPMEVHKGPVAFAICASIAGGNDKDSQKGSTYKLPVPKEWKAAAKNLKQPILMPDDILDVVWPASK